MGKISNNFKVKYKLDISVNVIATEYRFYADENGKINIPSEVQYGSEIKTLCSVLNTEGIVAINRLTDFVSSISHGKLNISNGEYSISKESFEKYSIRFDEILQMGFKENKKVKSMYYRHEEKKLLNRLKKYKSNYLLFIEDFKMPFDNNLSERELRHVKSKQKISGHFKSMIGAQAYLDIKSIILTCKKQGKNFYTVIKNIFDNTPVTI